MTTDIATTCSPVSTSARHALARWRGRGPLDRGGPDREFHYVLDGPLSDVLTGYVEQSGRYDEMLAGLDLEMPAERRMRGGEQVNLRWIIHHLIEENARHNGHLDILREMADGATGT